MEILCFFSGMSFFYTVSIYPLLFLALSLYFKPNWMFILYFIMALFWGFCHSYWTKEKGMPQARVIANAKLEGTIDSIPKSSEDKTQFVFHAQHLNGKLIDTSVLLSCYQLCPEFKPGQRWLFRAKLKRPQNLGNPGSFDLVKNLKAKHIDWMGYIHRGALKLEENKQQNFLIWREKLAKKMEKYSTKGPVVGILEALTLNVTSQINKDQWDLFRRTGTTHLMVISGSHIALIASFSFGLIKWIWSRSSRLCLLFPSLKSASLIALFFALIYALLAGFEPPSQRSLFACFFLFLRNFLSQRFTAWQAWRYGLLGVLIYEPHAVLLPGFYLSFIAVAILFLINQRFSGGQIKKAVFIQIACLFGLMPLTLFWFSYGAINGLVANLVAIPLVGFLIVPLALVHLFLLSCFKIQFLIFPLNYLTHMLLYYLNWVDSFSLVNLNFSYTQLFTPLALMVAMFVPLFLPMKAFLPAIMVLLLSSFFPSYPLVKEGNAQIHILDVGQGLAVVVRTAKHVLIYDTGMKFYHGTDMSKIAIIPYLNSVGIEKIDKLVISHPDLDHRGGLYSLQEKYPIEELLVDKPSFYHQGINCHKKEPWEWDGISFRFLMIAKKFRDKNNSSCVLKIENKNTALLLTGDIEKLAEDYLVENYRDLLKTDFLLVPHHGSKTSSSTRFIAASNPKYAIISSGFDNRYHFPHPQTLDTLKKQKIVVYNTADCGMVSVFLSRKERKKEPICFY